MLRYLLIPIVVLAAIFGIVYVAAGRAAAPGIQIQQPGKLVGQDSTLDLTVEAPRAAFLTLEITLEQKGKTIPLFSLKSTTDATVKQETPDRIRITRAIGRRAIPELQAGPARVVVTASRSVLHGLRTAESTAARDVDVRLTPPRIGIVSQFHFINLGGSEVVVYRVTPPDVQSGVTVGNLFYPGFPASGAGVATA